MLAIPNYIIIPTIVTTLIADTLLIICLIPYLSSPRLSLFSTISKAMALNGPSMANAT